MDEFIRYHKTIDKVNEAIACLDKAYYTLIGLKKQGLASDIHREMSRLKVINQSIKDEADKDGSAN